MVINDEIILSRQYYKQFSVYSVTFGDAVREIGEEAFADCENLEEVILPPTVVLVKKRAFANCPKLKKITFGYKTFFEADAFDGCYGLEELASNGTTARVFSLDDSKAYIVALPQGDLTKASRGEYKVYAGRYASVDEGFPASPINKNLALIFVVVIEKNGKEYMWFHRDINIALLGARYLASNRSFEEYFHMPLTMETKVSYEQFAILVGACYGGEVLWNICFKLLNMDPHGSYSIKFLLQVWGNYVLSVAERLRLAVENSKKVFSFLDMRHLLSPDTIKEQITEWTRHYAQQTR